MYNQNCYQMGTAPSAIRQLFAYGLKKAEEAGKENVFDYSLGNPSIPAPAAVNESILQLIRESDSVKLHGYSMAGGIEAVRKAVSSDLTVRSGHLIRPQNVFMTCGAAPALLTVLHALCLGPETEVIVVAPYFPEYKTFVVAAGCKLVILPPDIPDFQLNMELLEQYISEKTQAIILNSPNNPAGTVYTEPTLDKLARLLYKKECEYGHPIYIISDEPYRELTYDDLYVPYVPAYYTDTIICYSYSKSLSLPGERIGYICVPDVCTDSKELMGAVAGAARIIGHVCAPTLFQQAIAMCNGVRPDLTAYNKNRLRLWHALEEMGYECARPDGAFYLFVHAPGDDSAAFSEYAKTHFNLLIVPGDSFGCPSYFRLAYCVDYEMIERSLPAFKALIEEYRPGMK